MEVTRLDTCSLYHVRLGPGANLFQALRDFLQRENLHRAYVLSTIGSLRRVVINYPDTADMPPKVKSVTMEGLFEINGISGEVWRGADVIQVHLHGSITRKAETLYGGGLGDGAEVLKLAEMVIAGVT